VQVAKKWYSYFVVTDEQGRATSDSPASTAPLAGPVREINTASRAADLVPDQGPAVEAPISDAAGTVDLNDVYAAAQIASPAHGYSVLKIAEMLDSEHIRALPTDVKRKSIMVALDAAGVKVTDIVEDAVRRDRALDTYERVLQKHLDDLRAQTDADNKQIEDEIQQRVTELRARIDENAKKLAAEQDELQAWRTRKHQEEDLIATAVSYFVSENPITRGPQATADAVKGDADAR
jgi:hypothetical protein